MFKPIGDKIMYAPLFHIVLNINNFKHFSKVKYDEINTNTFGGYCKKQRIDKHLLIKDVADYIGVSKDTYMRIELNRVELLHMDKLKKLFKLLDINTEKICSPYQLFIMNNQGKQIKKFRKDNCMSQQGLADLLKVNRQRLSNWESNNSRIPYEIWLRFNDLTTSNSQ